MAGCEPIKFSSQDRILTMTDRLGESSQNDASLVLSSRTPQSPRFMSEQETGIFFICKGEVLILKNHFSYKKFLNNENRMIKEWKCKGQLTESINFKAASKVGWVITSFILKNEKCRTMIE